MERTRLADVHRTAQHRQWDKPAAAPQAWFPPFGRLITPATPSIMAAARARPGERVVELASGVGELALIVARLVGLAVRNGTSERSPPDQRPPTCLPLYSLG